MKIVPKEKKRMRHRKTLVVVVLAGILMGNIGCRKESAGTQDSASSNAGMTLYEASGTFYYWFYGLERKAGFGPIWSGPDPLRCFKIDIWDNRPDDFAQLIIQKLRKSYGMAANQESKAKDAIRSITFDWARHISVTWEKLVVTSPDPVLAADVANASMEVLQELDLKRHGGVLTNTMFKVMIRAEIATNIVTRDVAQRLKKQRDEWNRRESENTDNHRARRERDRQRNLDEERQESGPDPADVQVDVGDL